MRLFNYHFTNGILIYHSYPNGTNHGVSVQGLCKGTLHITYYMLVRVLQRCLVFELQY